MFGDSFLCRVSCALFILLFDVAYADYPFAGCAFAAYNNTTWFVILNAAEQQVKDHSKRG